MPIYGYARVSTCRPGVGYPTGRSCARPDASAFFVRRRAERDDDRRELKRMLRALRPGDVVIVTALDRLTRGGPFKTLSILNEITSRGAAYRSLAEPWADTTHELGEVLAALVGYIARKTREDIIRRTTAGRERARANGVKFGRRPKLISGRTAAGAGAPRRRREPKRRSLLSYEVSCSTISRLGQGRLVR